MITSIVAAILQRAISHPDPPEVDGIDSMLRVEVMIQLDTVIFDIGRENGWPSVWAPEPEEDP